MYILVPLYCNKAEPLISAITESIPAMLDFLHTSFGITLKDVNEKNREEDVIYDFEEWCDHADDHTEDYLSFCSPEPCG